MPTSTWHEWYAGEPNNGDEHCTVLSNYMYWAFKKVSLGSYKWLDFSCVFNNNNIQGYICERKRLYPELVYDWATSHGRPPFCNWMHIVRCCLPLPWWMHMVTLISHCFWIIHVALHAENYSAKTYFFDHQTARIARLFQCRLMTLTAVDVFHQKLITMVD